MTDELFLIDSNILAYAFDAMAAQKQQLCKNLIELCWNRNLVYVVSVQNLSEFYVTVTSKFENKVPKETAKDFVASIVSFKNWKVISPNANTIITAIEINERYNIHYWDALLAATMQENRIAAIYTEDNHFSRIPWLTTINPFDSIEEVI